MPRPPCCRRIAREPVAPVFRPSEAPAAALETVTMTLDELEAVRLADLEGLYQEQAAERMAVSRATFGRILEAAHRKVAEALVRGKVLRIEGGNIRKGRSKQPLCPRCACPQHEGLECPRKSGGGRKSRCARGQDT